MIDKYSIIIFVRFLTINYLRNTIKQWIIRLLYINIIAVIHLVSKALGYCGLSYSKLIIKLIELTIEKQSI